jgi:cyclopropane fatty-acyl-phospholipid synthase-like methyltransferase
MALAYDKENRIARARERAAAIDQIIGLRRKRVLEVGCGHGDFCEVLAEEYDCEVVGTELLPQSCWD